MDNFDAADTADTAEIGKTALGAVTARRPTLAFAPELLLRAQPIRLAFFDVDGVLTDGGLIYGAEGEALKRFNVMDGFGIKLLRASGIEPVIITGLAGAPLRRRAAVLGVTRAYYACRNKLAAAEATLTDLGLAWSQAGVIGDDWPDLALVARAAFVAAPANAHAEIKALAHYVTERSGGQGAVREWCDLLLCANGHYARAFEQALQGSVP
ncbi:MAG: 3-deoxy-D-manno-octulosonate 8-phosphate phosphatase [Rubrivivax sp.]